MIQSGPRQTGGILCVGEAPGADEDRIGKPFVGISGHELDVELQAAGINRSALFLTNVCHERPPANEIEKFFANKTEAKREGLAEIGGRHPRQPVLDGLRQLQADIDTLQPRLIIALGNTALWAFTGNTGILRWRGSILPATGGPVDGHGCKLIPTIHPALVVREQAYRAIAIQDLRRANRESAFSEIRFPNWDFTTARRLGDLQAWLAETPPGAPLVADVENFYETTSKGQRRRAHKGRLICLGLASSSTRAICIPFATRSLANTTLGPHWWDSGRESLATARLAIELRERPIIFHNGLHDCQIIAGNWGILPRFAHDTMLMQHVAFPGQLAGKLDPLTGRAPKKGSSLSLAFCSSMYCDYHAYWKDDGRGWDPEIHDEELYWRYNCRDCVTTYEVWEKLGEILRDQNLWEQYLFEMSLFEPVFSMMFRGFNYDRERLKVFRKQIAGAKVELQAWINAAVGHPLNVESSPQMKDLFYKDLQLPQILHRKTKQPTLDDKALDTLARRNPGLKPLISRIQAMRSLDTFEETYTNAALSPSDGRFRSAINVVGPETFRFSSNINAFGEGGNLQNIARDPD